MDLQALVSQKVGAVFQNPRAHLFHLRMDDEIAFGLRNLGLPENEVAERVDWALEALGLTDLGTQKPASLSGGQIQRVAIAAALAMRPQILVLDEPTASLDVPGTQSLITALDILRRQFGLTIILIEHRLAEVRRIADRVLVLNDGQVATDGEFGQILGDPHLRHRYGLRRPTVETLANWSDLLVPNGHPAGSDQPLLELRNLSAGYDTRAALHNIDLQIYAGEFVALVGDNGAGKSMLALAAAGLLKPLTGKVSSLPSPFIALQDKPA